MAVDVAALLAVLADTSAMLARPDNDYSWSSFPDAGTAAAEVDAYASHARATGEVSLMLKVLFAATGPIQEVAISSGWGDEFLALASRFDAAIGEGSH
jgi:hypothetical protein